jgi:uncharacterized RDD family membrane protein YckC
MKWYYSVSQQRLGPVSDTELAALVANGTITPDTQVWREGMAGWLPYSQACGPGSNEDPDHAICAVSGQRYPKSQMLQYEGRWVSAEHRDVFFQRLREGMIPAAADTMPGPYGYGGFWIRFGARFIDGILLTVVGQVTNGLLGILFYSRFVWVGQPAQPDPKALPLYFTYVAITMLAGVGIGLGYEWYFLAKHQATLGKMALGLKVVRADGSRLSSGRIIGRYFSTIVSQITLCIGYMMAGWDDEKRALHDRICDTRVIKTRA